MTFSILLIFLFSLSLSHMSLIILFFLNAGAPENDKVPSEVILKTFENALLISCCGLAWT